jgi:hypothetical protein
MPVSVHGTAGVALVAVVVDGSAGSGSVPVLATSVPEQAEASEAMMANATAHTRR